jgi:pSer/pThr/pTyr-binding forkhead associated (FHA) protein
MTLIRRQLTATGERAPGIPDAHNGLHRTPILVGMDGQYRGQEFPLTDDIVIGRDSRRCNVVIADSANEVSGVHCSIRYHRDSGLIELTDHQSTNGTYLNSRKIPSGRAILLKIGNKFRIARSDHYFQIKSI